jgi:hypothetical protein
MKKFILTALMFGFSSAAAAQYYEPIPYYGNNPFIFCTVGVPQDCWAPISKELGTFTVTNYYCFNAYSALLFARVCPKAFALGAAKSVMSTSSARDPADASP